MTAAMSPLESSVDSQTNHVSTTSKQYAIAPISPQDIGALKDLVVAVLQEFGCIGPNFASSDPELNDLYSFYNSVGGAYWVVYETTTGQLAGGAGFAPLKGTTPEERLCELQKIYLYPQYRGDGLGSQLMKRVIAGAAQKGFETMYLESVCQMTDAIAMYGRYGFRHLDGAMGGTGHSSCNVFMARPLTPEDATLADTLPSTWRGR